MAIQAQKYAEVRAAVQAEPSANKASAKKASATKAGPALQALQAKPAAANPQAGAEAAAGVRALVLSPTAELAAQSARVLKLLLPGTRVRGALLTASTVAGTDFSKVAS